MTADILQHMAEIQARRDGQDTVEACWLLEVDMRLKDLLNMAPALKLHSAKLYQTQKPVKKTSCHIFQQLAENFFLHRVNNREKMLQLM